jgi:hypothetical protein
VGTAEDTYLQTLLDGATAEAEMDCGRGFGVSTWKMVLDNFPQIEGLGAGAGYMPACIAAGVVVGTHAEGELRIPIRPVVTVTSVKYYDTAGVQQTMDAATYWVAAQTGRIQPKNGWPETEAMRPEGIEVVFTAGDAAGTLPPQAKSAILLILAARYTHRGDEVPSADPTGSSEIPVAAKRLLRQLWSGVL